MTEAIYDESGRLLVAPRKEMYTQVPHLPMGTK
jgi:hypothetical protein